MNVETTCKFCKRPITLEIDPSYDIGKDPMGLVPLACCNRCADLRERRRNIVAALNEVCLSLAAELNPSVLFKMKDEAREGMRTLLMKYRGLAEDWHHGDCGDWDEAMLDAVLASPRNYTSVLGRIWNMSRQPKAML